MDELTDVKILAYLAEIKEMERRRLAFNTRSQKTLDQKQKELTTLKICKILVYQVEISKLEKSNY